MPTLFVVLGLWVASLAGLVGLPVGSGMWLAVVVAAGVLTVLVGMNALGCYAMTRCEPYWITGALLCGTGAVSAVLAIATLIWRGLGVEVSAG